MGLAGQEGVRRGWGGCGEGGNVLHSESGGHSLRIRLLSFRIRVFSLQIRGFSFRIRA